MAKEERLGSSRRNLVFETSGSIRILVGDKYYPLNFMDSKAEDSNGTPVESNFIIANTIVDYEDGTIEYPGDGKIIFALSSGIFYTDNEQYLPFTFSETSDKVNKDEENIFEETVTFKGIPAFIVNDDTEIENLNANKLNGYTSDDFVKVKDFDTSIKEIHTEDGLLNYSDGILEVPTINSETISAKTVRFDRIDGPIIIGIDSVLEYNAEFNNTKLGINYGISLLEKLYNLYIEEQIVNITTNDQFLALVKNLLSPVDNDWNFTISGSDEVERNNNLKDIISLNLLHKGVNENVWKSTLTKDGSNLYDKILKYVSDSNYPGYSVLVFNGTSVSGFNVGYTFTTQNGDYGPINLTITGIDKDNNIIYAKSNVNTNEFTYSQLHTSNTDINGISINIKSYSTYGIEYPEDPSESGFVGVIDIDSVTITDKTGVLGSLNGINDPVFGELESNGLYVSKNTYFRDPSIAVGEENNIYIKINVDNKTFFGINDEGDPWITINPDGVCEINTSKYTLKSDGTAEFEELKVKKLTVEEQLIVEGDIECSGDITCSSDITCNGTLNASEINCSGTITGTLNGDCTGTSNGVSGWYIDDEGYVRG